MTPRPPTARPQTVRLRTVRPQAARPRTAPSPASCPGCDHARAGYQPRLRILSLGAGVQSTTCLLLALHERIPRFDVCLFADTGWETRAVYTHLQRLELLAAEAGMPIRRVRSGNIRADALDPAHRFASMPLFSLGPAGQRGMARRQCTSEYKLKPLKAEARRLLGYPPPTRVPRGVYAQMAIGISVDEVHRARDADVGYMRNTFPLLDLGWTRADCRRYLTDHGFGDTPRSACIGCPFHRDAFWTHIKQTSPAEWDDAVAFDHAIRHGSPHATATGHPLRGTFYLHHTRVPLDQAALTTRPAGGVDGAGEDVWAEPDGCSPFTCRTTHPTETTPAPMSASQTILRRPTGATSRRSGGSRRINGRPTDGRPRRAVRRDAKA
jgi:3'-phosphoadenosine 5'-phosphosulfate sulfotransferase (PAPS reductase)/FAD synthetase